MNPKPIKQMNGKGDRPRPVDKQKYDRNYQRIFKKQIISDNYKFIDANQSQRALKIVLKEFEYRTDKAGEPYMHHLDRVAQNTVNSSVDDELYCIALLHDLLEDIDSWTEDRLNMYFSNRIVNAVVLLTKQKNEDYESYISRIAENPDAAAVKLSDLADNMDITRLPELRKTDFDRLQKYHKAYKTLKFFSKIR